MKKRTALTACFSCLLSVAALSPAARAENLSFENTQAEVEGIAARSSSQDVGNCVIRRGGLIFHISAHGESGQSKCQTAGGTIYGNLCVHGSILRACEAE